MEKLGSLSKCFYTQQLTVITEHDSEQLRVERAQQRPLGDGV